MKYIATLISIILSIVAGGLWLFSYPEFSSGVLAIAYLLAFSDVLKFTRNFQFITFTTVSVLWSGLISFSCPNGWYLGIAILVFMAVPLSRLLFIKTFSYVNYKFYELSGALLGTLIGSITFFLNENIEWFYYVPTVVPTMLCFILAVNILNGSKQLYAGKQKNTDSIIGKQAPAFELEDQNGELTTLAQYKDERHLLLIFVRGDWCPYCHMILRTYFKNKEKFLTKDILVMAIGPDPVGINREMVEKLGLDYKVLSDDKLQTAMKYGIQLPEFSQQGATKHDEGMPLPASFLVDKKGIIRYTSSSKKVGEFLDPSMIFPIVDTLD